MGASFVNDFPKLGMDSELLPSELRLPELLAHLFMPTVSLSFDLV